MSGSARPLESESAWVVPLSDVVVDAKILAAVEEAVRSGWWSMGPRVAELESRFAAFCDTRHALAVANGTAALHIALLALECGRGDEVVLPSLNFVAAANVVAHTGAKPVFCDIRGPDDLNLNADDLEAVLTSATKAIVALHYGGHPCDLERVLAAAASRGIAVVEDAAHAPGATWQGRACGSLGAFGCFSFFSNKNLPVGEGGMLVTDDDELATRARLLRSHGMTTLTWDRHRGHASSYDVVAPGFNYRLDEIRAAIALVQLERLAEGNRARARLVHRYRSVLSEHVELLVPFAGDDRVVPSHHLAVVVLPDGVDRDGVRARLAALQIQTSVHYPPIHRFSAYVQAEGSRSLPHTEEVAGRLLTLPLYPHLLEEEVDAVCAALIDAVHAEASPVSAGLAVAAGAVS